MDLDIERFSQEQLFELIHNERNALKDFLLNYSYFEKFLEDKLKKAEAAKSETLRWRTRDYVVYSRCGNYDEPPAVGEKVIYREKYNENNIAYVFEIPDIKDPLDNTKRLSESNHMLFFDVLHLKYEPKKRIVSVADSFDPIKHLKSLYIKRANLLGKIVGDIFQSAHLSDENSKYIYQREYREYGAGSNGYHGSVTLGYIGSITKERKLEDIPGSKRYIFATEYWFRKCWIAIKS